MISIRKLAAAVLLTTVQTLSYAAPSLDGFSLVFSDEFTGSSLDTNKWNTAHLWGPFLPINGEEQYYVDSANIDSGFAHSPFQFTGDTLKIVASPITPALLPPALPPASDSVWTDFPEYNRNENYNNSDPNYYSGIITSYDSFRFTYGYAEARMKVPAGKGLWPAFWLFKSHFVEDFPEIDIMELLGDVPNKVYHSYHYTDLNQGWETISLPTGETVGPDYSQNFHTYSVAWEPNLVIWYVDGVEARRITDADGLIAKQSMYVLANLAVGGTWPQSPDATTVFPAELEIDYIRVYQKDPPATITPAVLASDYQLMFSDEFSGSSVDTTKWNSAYLWGPYWQINNEQQFYPDIFGINQGHSPSPFSVSNGTLKITAQETATNDFPSQPAAGDSAWSPYPEYRHSLAYQNPNYTNPTGDTSLAAAPFLPEYTSGVLTSYESFKFVNGYVEISAKVPEGAGLWPALWLLNGYYVDRLPEIDIMELQGEAPDIVHQTFHYSNDVGQQISSPTTVPLNQGNDSYADNFHTYGVEWNPDTINWYIDGVKTKIQVNDGKARQLMYIILNLAVGGNFVGNVDNNALPAQFEIDYVRAYQLKWFGNDILTDTTAPTVTVNLAQPSASTPISMPYLIDGTATDSGGAGLSQIRILLRDRIQSNFISPDGTRYSSWNPAAEHTITLSGTPDQSSWSLPLDSSTLGLEPTTKYAIHVLAVDANNNQINNWPRTYRNFELVESTNSGDDDTAPTVTINLAQAPANTPISSPYLIDGTASDSGGAGLSEIRILLRDRVQSDFISPDGTRYSSWNPAAEHIITLSGTPEQSNWSLPLDVSTLGLEPTIKYAIHVLAVDGNNNQISNWPRTYRNFELVETINNSDDITAPSVTVNLAQPPANTLVSTPYVIDGTAIDTGGAGLSEISILLRDRVQSDFISPDGTRYSSWNPAAEHIITLSGTPDQSNWSLPLDISTLGLEPNSKYAIHVLAVDANNNQISNWPRTYRNFKINE